MTPVIVESPYAGARWDVLPDHPEARNLRYLRACMNDCVRRGETPYASHGLLTQPGVLRDEVPEERDLGIRLGFAMAEVLAAAGAPRAFYVDEGWRNGMAKGFLHAWDIKQRCEFRRVPGWVSSLPWAGPFNYEPVPGCACGGRVTGPGVLHGAWCGQADERGCPPPPPRSTP